jgi:hypothetical protein
LVKKLYRPRDRAVEAFQGYLAAKKAAAESAHKAAELQAPKDALAGHAGTHPTTEATECTGSRE